MNLNKVMLAGNLVRDIELRHTSGNTAVGSFSLAINRKYKKGDEWCEETTFVDCTAWGKQAETLAQYLSKGRGVFVEGRLRLEQWDDKNGGGKRSKLSVTVENFQFVGGKGEGAPRGGGGPGAQPSGDDDSSIPFSWRAD